MNLTQKIQSLTAQANNTTGKSDTTLSDAVESLIEGFGPNIDVQSLSVTENNTYQESGVAYSPVVVQVPNTYTASDEGKVVSGGALVSQTSRNITTNGTVDTTLNNQVVVNVPNTYTQADEGKVVSGGALTAQTSRTVSDNGTYDTTLNNEVVVNNTDYSESLVAFGVEDDLADGIEAMTTYANEVTGESDTTLSDAVRTLADGYGGGGGETLTGFFFGDGGLTVSIPCDFNPDIIYIFSPNKLDSFPMPSGSASWALYWSSLNCVILRKTTNSITAAAGYIMPTSNDKPGKLYANGVVTVNLPGSSAYQFQRGAKYDYYFSKMQFPARLPEEYQEVSCLACDGGQYIDSGYYPNTIKTKVEIGIMSNSKDVTQGVFGARNNTLAADDTSCNMFALAAGNLRLDWVNGDVSTTFAFAVGTYYDISCTRGRATVNGTVMTGTNTASVNTTGPFLIGNFYNDDAPYSTGFKGKIFYTKLYDEDVLIRDLVPCYRKADDKPGMYDLVNDVFYVNAGTGEFSVGGDI